MMDTIVVFTSKTIDEILRSGGSQYWRLKPANARKMTYLVCVRNAKESVGPEPHRSGFLFGRVSGIAPTKEVGRYLIQIDEWAKIEVLDVWDFGRNPVHYTEISDLGIDPETIKFQSVSKPRAGSMASHAGRQIVPLSIEEAKQGLAMKFGVGLDAIEITIRG